MRPSENLCSHSVLWAVGPAMANDGILDVRFLLDIEVYIS
jgi:hypothetical protein